MRPRTTATLLLSATLLAIGAFYVSTLRAGHYWGGDFSQYIHHARNIALGRPYGDTGYIFNPFAPEIGPPTYPPVFPLLLAPIYYWFGLNLAAMKLALVVVFLLSLLLIFQTFSSSLPPLWSLIVVAIVGFNPFFWEFKDQILSDMPFLLTVYLFLFLLSRAHSSESVSPRLHHGLVIGISLYLAYGTRSLGIALLPCLFVWALHRCRRAPRLGILAAAVFLGLGFLQTMLIHSDSGYLLQFRPTVATILRNLVTYPKSLATLWDNGYSHPLQALVLGALSLLALLGYVGTLRRRPSPPEAFPLAYGSILLLWPSNQGIRFLIPLIPLYIFYTLIGVRMIGRKWFRRPVPLLVVMGAIVTTYAARYTTEQYGPLTEGVSKTESVELFGFVRSHTSENDVFIFAKPRVLSLFTGRKASGYHADKNDGAILHYFAAIHATYLVVSGLFASDTVFLRPFVSRNRHRLSLVFKNPDFEVYRLRRVGYEDATLSTSHGPASLPERPEQRAREASVAVAPVRNSEVFPLARSPTGYRILADLIGSARQSGSLTVRTVANGVWPPPRLCAE